MSIRVAAKKIESQIKKSVGLEVNGYNIIEEIDEAALKEANNLGMENGITEPYEFEFQDVYTEYSITFYVSMCEEFRDLVNLKDEYYYTYVDSCTIKRNNVDDQNEKDVTLEVYWGK
jgi:hypothetical protein